MIERAIRIVLPVMVLAGLTAAAWYYRQHARTSDFANVAYGRTSPSQHPDIYVSPGPGPFPVVLFSHGGAFMFGDKRGIGSGLRNDVDALNAAGIALVSIDYRQSGEAEFPATIHELESALRFVRANAAHYRDVPSRVALWGRSAGANIALVAGMSPGVALFNNPATIAPAADDRVSAIVSMYGPTDFPAMDAELGAAGCDPSAHSHNAADSPELRYLGAKIFTISSILAKANLPVYLGAAALPLLIQHGTADCTVPPLQRHILADRLTAAGPGRAVLQFHEGAVHADSALDSAANVALGTAFLRQAFGTQKHVD